MTVLIKDVIDYLLEPAGRLEHTVDGLVAGDPNAEVKGIATAFMATQEAIEQALKAGANLLISHEGIYYSHENDFALQNDPVAREKHKRIAESGIAIFRLHDYVHRYQPDGIMAGLIEEAGWQAYVREYQPAAALLDLPPQTVKEIAGQLKQRLAIPHVRVVGDPDGVCVKIGLLVGYRGGGKTAIPLFAEHDLDLVIAGESPEWETPEYVRDAVYQGRRQALMLLGHGPSEAPGMKLLAARLRARFAGVPVFFIGEKPLFTTI